MNANRDGAVKNKDKDIPKVFVFLWRISLCSAVAFLLFSDTCSIRFWSVMLSSARVRCSSYVDKRHTIMRLGAVAAAVCSLLYVIMDDSKTAEADHHGHCVFKICIQNLLYMN